MVNLHYGNEEMNWSTMVNLHYGNEENQRKLAQYLEGYWTKAREEHYKGNTHSFRNSYGALEELYRTIGTNDPTKFMRVVIFSMRHRARIGRVNWEKYGPREQKEWRSTFLKGWWAMHDEWAQQANPTPKKNKDMKTERERRRDSLTELILCYEDLRRSDEFYIGATLQRVRRLRKSSDEDTTVLEYSNSLLRGVDEKWPVKKEQTETRLQQNFMACPNEMLGMAIKMQFWLNRARQANLGGRDLSEISGEIQKLDEYEESLSKDNQAERTWSYTYRWWFHRIWWRILSRRFNWKEAEIQKERMNRLQTEANEPLKSYLARLVEESKSDNKGKEERDNTDPYYRLSKYHLMLSHFLHNPTDKFLQVRRPEYPESNNLIHVHTHWSKRIEEERRYLEYVSFPKGTWLRKLKVHQFIDTTHKRPIVLVDHDGKIIVTKKGRSNPTYSKKWAEDRNADSLIQKCRFSISNSRLMTLNIVSNNSHIAPATLLLNAIDLMVKVRWFLAVPQIYRPKYGHKKSIWMLEDKYGNTFRKDNEIGIAEDIRGGLVSALKDIEYGLDLCKANKPREAIEICRKSIDNIDIKGSEVISPLGKICGHIGKILGWGHKTPNKDLGREGEMYGELSRILNEINELTVNKREETSKEDSRPAFTSTERQYDQMTLTDLRKECKTRALPLSGTKAELVLLLEEYKQLSDEKKKLKGEIRKMQEILLLKDPETSKEIIRIAVGDSDMNPYLRPVGENQVNLLYED